MTVGDDDLPGDNKSSGSGEEEHEDTDVLFASIFGFLSCHVWLILLLITLIVLTLLDKKYSDMRKIFMLSILGVLLVLALLGYIPCNLWVFLLILLAIAYILFRRYSESE